jgi:uncharacterized transporter YbjL
MSTPCDLTAHGLPVCHRRSSSLAMHGPAFACNNAGSHAPTVAYATVYPPTTLLRILSAQALAIVLFR